MRRSIQWLIACTAFACADRSHPTADSTVSWVISSEPVLIIGVDDALPGHALFGVQSAMRLADGSIAIVNGGSAEIRFFSAAGGYLRSAGGRGRGPAEFAGISSVARAPGDTIVVLTSDPAVAWVTPDAQVTRKIPISWANMRFRCRIDEGPDVLADGTLLFQGEDNPGGPGCPPFLGGVLQNTDLLARVDPVAGKVDSLGIFPGTDRDGERYAAFGRMLAITASTDKIFAGETGGDTIRVFSYGREHLATLRVPLERIPIPEAVRSRQPQPRRMPDGQVVTPAPYNFPELYPRFGRLITDRSGNLWVMSYPALANPTSSYRLNRPLTQLLDSAGAAWTVIDSNGAVIAIARTPPGLYVFEIGADYILGLARNELDVESVRLYSLTR